MGRAAQDLGLMHLAIPCYEVRRIAHFVIFYRYINIIANPHGTDHLSHCEVLAHKTPAADVATEQDTSSDLSYEAAHNLAL
eukprot:scaffold508652_cov19-Prasinocladus_malaysianus.AAC.1